MYFNLYFQRIVALTVSNQTGFTFLLFNTVNRDIKHCDIPYGGAEAGHRPPLLQVGFSVQVGRLNVANTVGV